MGKRKKSFPYLHSRPTWTREVRPIVAILCDDTKTAGLYFKAIQRMVKETRIKPIACPCKGASAEQLEKTALSQKKNLKEPHDHLWILLDREAEKDKQDKADTLLNKYGQDGLIRVALSNPCFEVWTLAHLADTGKAFQDCSAVVSEIRRLWKQEFHQEFKKSSADYAKLITDKRIEDAIERAEKHKNDPSWTHVYRVINDLLPPSP